MASFNFKTEDFEKIKQEAEKFYGLIGKCHCPYFKETIAFNAKGLRHLKFKSDRIARSSEDQYARLKLLKLAPEILKLSHTVQGIWKIRRFEDQKTNSRWEKIMKDVVFYEFLAVIGSVRVKIIVKEASGGEKHFWSIIPFWGIDRQNQKRILHSGNPEND
jgi:hypothetical protein